MERLMGRHPGEVDRTTFVTLRPTIVRAYWGAARAWNGGKVDMFVETRWTPDGTPLEIVVVADRGPDEPVEKLPAGLTVENNRCVHKHEIAWTHQHLAGHSSEPTHFHFIVRIPRFGSEARSNALYVDRGHWSHSS
jgi:hypothetical protein